jgi:hypothetical protein
MVRSMRVSPAAVTVLVILVALGVSANACMAVPPPASDVPLDASATPVIDETPTPQAAEQAADDAAPSPSPAASAGPSPSPAVASRPAKASPVPSPSAEAMTDLVAVALSKDNRIAEIDPVSGRVVRVVDISRPAGAFALTPDARIGHPSRCSMC